MLISQTTVSQKAMSPPCQSFSVEGKCNLSLWLQKRFPEYKLLVLYTYDSVPLIKKMELKKGKRNILGIGN